MKYEHKDNGYLHWSVSRFVYSSIFYIFILKWYGVAVLFLKEQNVTLGVKITIQHTYEDT